MTQNPMPSGPNHLAEKLRREYLARGQALYGVSAASTEELMERALQGYDPKENVSQAAFRDRLQDRHYMYKTSQTIPKYASRTADYKASYTRTNAGYKGNEKQEKMKSGYAASAKRQNTETVQKQPVQKKTTKKKDTEKATEIRVQRRKMPLGYICTLVLITAMIVSILLSIAQIYQTTNTISDLEKELDTLQAAAQELELALEEKNDIRIIEQIATDQLGMVKEDSVQRKYISLSDGERIDIIGGTENNETQSLFGTMLSSIAAALGNLLDSLS